MGKKKGGDDPQQIFDPIAGDVVDLPRWRVSLKGFPQLTMELAAEDEETAAEKFAEARGVIIGKSDVQPEVVPASAGETGSMAMAGATASTLEDEI